MSDNVTNVATTNIKMEEALPPTNTVEIEGIIAPLDTIETVAHLTLLVSQGRNRTMDIISVTHVT